MHGVGGSARVGLACCGVSIVVSTKVAGVVGCENAILGSFIILGQPFPWSICKGIRRFEGVLHKDHKNKKAKPQSRT